MTSYHSLVTLPPIALVATWCQNHHIAGARNIRRSVVSNT